MHLLYILEKFPSKTEYFVLNEIKELRKRNVMITIVAHSSENEYERNVRDVYYRNKVSELRGHIFFVFKAFKKYVTALSKTLKGDKNGELSLTRRLWYFNIAIGYYFQIKLLSIDHIHAHFAFWPTKIAVPLAALLGKSFSFTAHAQDIYANNLPRLRFELERASFVITCTRFNHDYLNQISPKSKEKVYHIYHGIPLQKWPFKHRKSISKGKPVFILAVSSLVSKKGLFYLLHAVDQLLRENIDLKCTIVGDGPLKAEILTFILERKLQGSISLTGYLKQSELINYYHKADIFVSPSIISKDGDRDGLPNSLLESLASGLPAIATNVSAIPELIDNETTGLLIAPESSESIAKSVKILIHTPDLYNSLSINGRRLVESRFDINSATKKLLDLFSAVMR